MSRLLIFFVKILHIKNKKEVLLFGIDTTELYMDKILCFIDTEFNACDNSSSNDGYQEIIQIGAVIFKGSKKIDSFNRYCKLQDGHRLTKRCKNITGITQELINKKGINFNQAMSEFEDFLKKHHMPRIYAFGAADENEMRITAKLNNASGNIFDIIRSIKNVYPMFQQRLELHYLFSLYDICRICKVDHGKNRAHSALNDAEDTGLAFFNMLNDNIDSVLLKELNVHKYNVKLYRENRSIDMINIKHPDEADADFMEKLEKIFKKAEDRVRMPVLTALHDDMMRIVGRPDLEKGESFV